MTPKSGTYDRGTGRRISSAPPKRDYNDRAHRDAMRHIAQDIPDPIDFAWQLDGETVAALRGARQVMEGQRIDELLVRKLDLRRRGLVGFGSNCLTAFGIKVRRVLAKDDA